MREKSKNYWPHAIIASILLVALGCAYTVVVALKNPVEMDSFYFQSYQEVDKNYDKIEALQKVFDEKYNILFKINDTSEGNLHLGTDNILTIAIGDEKQRGCDFDVNAKFLLTKPETNRYNQDLKISRYSECELFFEPITVDKAGRWQFQAKITINKDIGFFIKEVNATSTEKQ